MLPMIVTVCGALLMLFGVCTLLSWAGGKSRWFDPSVFDRGDSKSDRQLLDLYYVALVLAPLLSGAVMLVLGLKRWL